MAMRFEPHLLVRGSVHLLPVLHGSLEFAQLCVEAVRSLAPKAIAVELPRSLQGTLTAAVGRLPQLSAVRYLNARRERVVFLIEPADPLIEAVRLGLERKIPVHFVDLDLDDYPDRAEPLPDAYAVARIGHRAYYEAYLGSPSARDQAPEDARREAAMAARLTQLSEGAGPVLFVCGMAHAERVAAQIGLSAAEPLDRAHRSGVALVNLHPDSCREVLSTWGYLGAAYERARAATLGLEVARPQAEVEGSRVINLFERAARPEAPVAPPRRSGKRPGPLRLPVDRQRALLDLFADSAERYRATTGEEVKPYHRRVWLKFLRNWSVLRGRLQPILFQVVVGARAAVDDNFAYELFQLAARWPWQRERAEIPTEKVSLEDLRRSAELVRFRPRQITRRLRAMAGRPKLSEKELLKGFRDPFSHCSYPPEDMALERFSTYVQKKGRGVLSEENRRVEPFTTSLMDGIDMRETLRNWHQGKLYVQELRKDPGGVGSVVVVFDDETDRYPWQITWLGEVEEEGDMALFATHPLEQVVGPGICRAEYGGFLLSYPPGRMSDVWSDEAFEAAQTRAERLLMAGIEYCEKKLVAYVAKKPPRAELKSLASRFGKKVVYLPIGQFSPDTLKRLRVFHVLFGKEKREFAKDYIW
jgi:hypothetical protein